MIRAVILDFYGTVVQESYELLDAIADVFVAGGASCPRSEVPAMWWREFRAACDAAHGDAFCLQRELYPRVLKRMAARCGAKIDEERLAGEIVRFSRNAGIFEDAARFLRECPLPWYVLSNIDNAELAAVLSRHRLTPCGVFTSEDAREYKPRAGIFEKGLRAFGLRADDALYAGDSYRNDYCGARGAGMRAVWLNRLNEPVPEGTETEPDLYSVLVRLRSEGAV